MARVRVLCLMTDAYGGYGGIAQFNREILDALAAADADVLVLTRDRHSAATDQVEQRGLGGKLSFVFGSLRIGLKFKPDVILCGHINFMPLCWILAKFRRSPLWLQVHGIDAWTSPGWSYRWLLQDVSLVTSVSRYTRKKLLEWSWLAEGKVRILPNVAPDEFAPSATHLREELRIPTEAKVLLTVGRLSSAEQYKGHDHVIRSLPGLSRKFENLIYVVAGDGDDKARLEALAIDQAVSDSVIFLGRVSQDKLNSLYNTADAFLMPSSQEGFGIVFLEAIAAGTPVVGLQAGGTPDALQDGALGTLSTLDDLEFGIAEVLEIEVDRLGLSEQVKKVFGRNLFQQEVSFWLRQIRTGVH